MASGMSSSGSLFSRSRTCHTVPEWARVRACEGTPDSVQAVISLSACGGGRSWPGGCYPPSPLRLRCERAMVVQTHCAPTRGPAPHTLLPIGQRSRLAAGIAADAGALLPHPFTPHPGRTRAGLLSVAVLRHAQLSPRVPPLAVSRGGLLPGGGQQAPAGEESGSSSRRGVPPSSDGASQALVSPRSIP
jgi:hypothetical protein